MAEFIGLINENGMSRSSFQDESSITFSLCAYSRDRGPVEENEAFVYMKIPSLEYSVAGLEPLTIVEFTGEQISYHGQNRIILSSVIKTNSNHPELQSILDRRLEPVIYKSQKFGNFILDRRLDWFEGKVEWLGEKVGLTLCGDLDHLAKVEATAIALFDKQRDWDIRFRDRIVETLLSLANENWCDVNGSLLTEQKFRDKIQLQSLTVRENEFEAWYDDGGIFLGHAISVDGSVDGHLSEAMLHG